MTAPYVVGIDGGTEGLRLACSTCHGTPGLCLYTV